MFAMRILITGISGFAGSFLADSLLQQPDVNLTGVIFGPEDHAPRHPRLTRVNADLSDPARTLEIVRDAQPDQIYHLAAQAFVPEAWSDPWATLANNIRAQVNILNAVAQLGQNARILVVGTSEEYGHVAANHLPIREDTPLRPDNPYAVSKIAQDFLGLQYHLSHDLYTIRVRPFNHIGPRQSDRFVAANFARQIAEIEAGQREPVVHVGNLQAVRDFTDVRDMMRAYVLALTHGEAGEVYNIGSGQPRAIQELLDTYLRISGVTVRVEPEPARLRVSDTPVAYCDATKFRTRTGWAPTIPFEQTLRDTLEYWRQVVNKETSKQGNR
jgi:GDP-4-dehydro-6-deoxy-D-mannose reductase